MDQEAILEPCQQDQTRQLRDGHLQTKRIDKLLLMVQLEEEILIKEAAEIAQVPQPHLHPTCLA
jgi:hypothetical protein